MYRNLTFKSHTLPQTPALHAVAGVLGQPHSVRAGGARSPGAGQRASGTVLQKQCREVVERRKRAVRKLTASWSMLAQKEGNAQPQSEGPRG